MQSNCANYGVHVLKHNNNIMPEDAPELTVYLVVEDILGFVFGDIHWGA